MHEGRSIEQVHTNFVYRASTYILMLFIVVYAARGISTSTIEPSKSVALLVIDNGFPSDEPRLIYTRITLIQQGWRNRWGLEAHDPPLFGGLIR